MKTLLILLMCLVLNGCATLQDGNFSQTTETQQRLLARDAVAMLERVYPPAHTTLTFKQPRDVFGLSLLEGLRKKGFRITAQASLGQSTVFYIVDEPLSHRLFRVTLVVGLQQFSRAYGIRHGIVKPISPWAKREASHEKG